MWHELKEALEKLQTFLNQNKKQPQKLYQDVKALEADIQWDAARFFAALLLKAELPISPSRNDFEIFRREYQAQQGTAAPVKELFADFWLRDVMGSVHMASGIYSAVNYFAEIRNFRKEMLFLRTLPKSERFRDKIILTEQELNTAIQTYEAAQHVTLNREGVLFKRWSETTNEQIAIVPIDHYYGVFLDSWERFEFLFHWKNNWPDEERGLVISEEALNVAIGDFNRFPAVLSLLNLLDQHVIKKVQDNFYLNFFSTEPAYWSVLCDRIAGFLWEALICDDSYPDDVSRLNHFLKKALMWNAWPNHLRYVTVTAKKSFLEASMNVLLSQDDLSGVTDEFCKVQLDSAEYRGLEVLVKQPLHYYEDNILHGDDLFELYQSLTRLKKNSSTTYLQHQPARMELTFLVRTVVTFDHEYAQPGLTDTEYFKGVVTLLRKGSAMPFLLLTTAHYVVSEHPEIIPYLVTQQNTSTLAFSLLDELEFPDDAVNLNRQAWVQAVCLLLKSLPEIQDKDENATIATILFQLFRQLNHNKYSLPFTRNIANEEISRKAHAEKESEVLMLLENALRLKGRFVRSQAPYLLPCVFDDLTQRFSSFQPVAWRKNETVQFPLLKWDGIFWLLKLHNYWKYQATASQRNKAFFKLSNYFTDQYLALLELREIAAYNYEEQRENQVIPIWSERVERLERLDWFYPVYALNQLGKLGNFLAPRFQFELSTEHYNKINEFNANKLRTHIGVLLQSLLKLTTHTIPYTFVKDKIAEIQNRLEEQIIVYIDRYMQSQPEDGRVDIFSYNKEWMHHQTDKEALLPRLARALDWFQNKQRVIEAILSTGDMIKWLILLDYVTTEGVKKAIIHKISQANISHFLQQLTWLPEVQTVLVKISQYPELIQKFEEALGYWKELSDRRTSRKYKEQLFLSSLLLAYLKNDEKAIDDLLLPGEFHGSTHTMNYRDQKEFYRGLIFINSNPQRAFGIFNGLVHHYRLYPVVGMNRMVAKMKLAESTGHRNSYWEAYEEWRTVQTEYYATMDTTYLEPNLSANLMEILFHVQDFDEQDKVFAQLDEATRMLPSILTVRIKSLVAKQRRLEAMTLIEAAKIYHQFADYSSHQFLQDLEYEAKGLDNVEDLKLQYHRIFGSAPSKLVAILPDTWNDKKSLHTFLVKEIVNAAGKLLEKIKSIEEIGFEDKYNDLVELVLDARLNGFGWQVGAQNRGAFSAPSDRSSGKQPGERDIPVFDANKNMLLNCEALIYRGASNTPDHLQKVFNSHHNKAAFVILLYDTGVKKKGFDGNWEEYITTYVPSTPFPAGAEITSNLEEVSEEFGSDASAVKVGRSVHGGKTILYHVFVNINYHLRLPQIQKQKRKAKNANKGS
jgi:hypothetical protein